MSRVLALLALLGLFGGCAPTPATPEHVCAVYMQCINAQRWAVAARYILDVSPSILQLSPLLTKNYQYKAFSLVRVDYGPDSTQARVRSRLLYTDDTYADAVFLVEKHPTNQWKIKSL